MIAHGVGERGDLPLPLYVFIWGLGIAIAISFVALAAAWDRPRLRAASVGKPFIGAGVTRPLFIVGQAIGLALYVLSLLAGWFGDNQTSNNLLPVTLYVTVWVGAQLFGGLLGDVWQWLNPIHSLSLAAEKLSLLLGRRPRGGPTSWGHWPATVGLLIFLFFELSHPNGSKPRDPDLWFAGLTFWLTAHGVLCFVSAFLWGARWTIAHEPFTVFFSKIAAMAPLFSGSDPSGANDGEASGGLRRRAPLAGLAVMPVKVGTVALVLTAIGGTSFDGFSESQLGREVFSGYTRWGLAVAELIGMFASIALVTLLYAIGVAWITRVTGLAFGEAWRQFAPSLVPIAFGYAIAHYFLLFVDNIQAFWFRLSNPFGADGVDYFGAAGGIINPIDLGVVTWVQVVAILIGHVGAIAVAHDRSIELFPPGRSMQSQFAMLFVMIAYSSLGLWLLFNA